MKNKDIERRERKRNGDRDDNKTKYSKITPKQIRFIKFEIQKHLTLAQ